MAETISMPKLGFDMSEGVLVHWVKNEGENINKGDVLAEIETDKATVEVESSAGGVVRKLLASEGDVVPVGAAIAIGSTPRMPLMAPSRDSSPSTTVSSMARRVSWPDVARRPSAIGKSNDDPALRTSAGARFTVMRCGGNGNPEFLIAARTRSRLSRTVASGSPTIVK